MTSLTIWSSLGMNTSHHTYQTESSTSVSPQPIFTFWWVSSSKQVTERIEWICFFDFVWYGWVGTSQFEGIDDESIILYSTYSFWSLRVMMDQSRRECWWWLDWVVGLSDWIRKWSLRFQRQTSQTDTLKLKIKHFITTAYSTVLYSTTTSQAWVSSSRAVNGWQSFFFSFWFCLSSLTVQYLFIFIQKDYKNDVTFFFMIGIYLFPDAVCTVKIISHEWCFESQSGQQSQGLKSLTHWPCVCLKIEMIKVNRIWKPGWSHSQQVMEMRSFHHH